jgi:hypothetical protein
MKKFARYALNIVATVVLGDLLARYVANLPVEWPWLTGSIAYVLHALNLVQYDNPDDMFDLAGLVILFACLIIAGAAVWLLNIAARHYRQNRLHTRS